MAPRVAVITMGCSKNRVDSEHLMRQLQAAGLTLVPESDLFDDGRLDIKKHVDYLLVNTCGFIDSAKAESIDLCLEAARYKAAGMVDKIFVFGCLSQRYPKELTEEMPEIDGFFGTNIAQTPEGDRLLRAVGCRWNPACNNERVLSTPAHIAYLKIAEGCNRRCAYCAIPLIRGPYRSQSMENLIGEARFLARGGVKELIIVAQDITCYGWDLYRKKALARLLEQLCSIEGITWIRLHYLYPRGFPLDVLRSMASEAKICNYIDIPLQHISDKVLSAMRRSVTSEQTRRLVERFRKELPGVCLRTTFMVGHPAEDRAAFEDLMRFVEETRFERMGAFIYSHEEGTYDALHNRDSVTKKTKASRYERLMLLQQGISFAYNRSRVGKQYPVMIDGVRGRYVVGRTQNESWEVDGLVYFPRSEFLEKVPAVQPGTIVQAVIDKADAYDLKAHVL